MRCKAHECCFESFPNKCVEDPESCQSGHGRGRQHGGMVMGAWGDGGMGDSMGAWGHGGGGCQHGGMGVTLSKPNFPWQRSGLKFGEVAKFWKLCRKINEFYCINS